LHQTLDLYGPQDNWHAASVGRRHPILGDGIAIGIRCWDTYRRKSSTQSSEHVAPHVHPGYEADEEAGPPLGPDECDIGGDPPDPPPALA
jgi:hypothetical protein